MKSLFGALLAVAALAATAAPTALADGYYCGRARAGVAVSYRPAYRHSCSTYSYPGYGYVGFRYAAPTWYAAPCTTYVAPVTSCAPTYVAPATPCDPCAPTYVAPAYVAPTYAYPTYSCAPTVYAGYAPYRSCYSGYSGWGGWGWRPSFSLGFGFGFGGHGHHRSHHHR